LSPKDPVVSVSDGKVPELPGVVEHLQAPVDPLQDLWHSDDDCLPRVFKRRIPPQTSDDESGPTKRMRTNGIYVYCFVPSLEGTTVKPTYLVDYTRKRTVIVDVEDALRMPEMRAAMDKEIASFRNMSRIEKVKFVGHFKRG
jgi:hypothetical protein